MKRRIRLIALICILALLGGCGQLGELSYSLETVDEMFSPETQELAVLETQTPLYTDGAPAILWGREQLDEETQRAYDDMSAAIAAYQETPLVVNAGAEEIRMILDALRIDHPEYFWFDGKASFVSTTLAGVNIRTECTFEYNLTREEIQVAHQTVRQYTAACLSAVELSGAQSDYDKILAVYRYIIEHTDYDLSDPDQSILSVMIRHRGTCAGYSRTFQYLMSQLGIPCTLAMGEVSGGEAHGWNMVQCGGNWYQMDVTWGDPLDEYNNPGSTLQYTYCMLTDQEMYRDHTLTSLIPMPRCDSTEYHYFTRLGRLYADWSPAEYEAAMASAVENGETWFAVRFTNQEAYEAACADLFDLENIWTILRETGGADAFSESVSYTRQDAQYEISVKLEPPVFTESSVNEETYEGSEPW